MSDESERKETIDAFLAGLAQVAGDSIQPSTLQVNEDTYPHFKPIPYGYSFKSGKVGILTDEEVAAAINEGSHGL